MNPLPLATTMPDRRAMARHIETMLVEYEVSGGGGVGAGGAASPWVTSPTLSLGVIMERVSRELQVDVQLFHAEVEALALALQEMRAQKLRRRARNQGELDAVIRLGRPARGQTAFQLWKSANIERVRRELQANPRDRHKNVDSECDRMWLALDAASKQPYEERERAKQAEVDVKTAAYEAALEKRKEILAEIDREAKQRRET